MGNPVGVFRSTWLSKKGLDDLWIRSQAQSINYPVDSEAEKMLNAPRHFALAPNN